MHPRDLVLRLLPSSLVIAVLIGCERQDAEAPVGQVQSGTRVQLAEFPTPPPAALLRRAAGIADAFQTGDTIYIVISVTFPHPVVGVFQDSALADSSASANGPDFGVLKALTPLPSPSDEAEAAALVLPGCYKNKYTTQWECPLAQSYKIPSDSVSEVELIIRTTGGDSLAVTVAGDSAAAFILSLDGFDKFLVPYYTSVFGAAYVAQLRDSLVAALDTLPPLP